MATAPIFTRYTLEAFIEEVIKPAIKAGIVFTEVHVHGTDKPTKADFYKRGGQALQQSMWRFHTGTRGFADIAQHATIDPDGFIWAGRPLTMPPASATGYNDSDPDKRHPFMFEMIGQFDKGNEVLEGAQLSTSIGLCRAIMDLMNGGLSMIKFHREMTNAKTCPGSSIEKGAWLAMVEAYELVKMANTPKEDKPAGNRVKIVLDGVALPEGFIMQEAGGGVTYAPVRALAEALGLKVTWEAATKTVILTKGEDKA